MHRHRPSRSQQGSLSVLLRKVFVTQHPITARPRSTSGMTPSLLRVPTRLCLLYPRPRAPPLGRPRTISATITAPSTTRSAKWTLSKPNSFQSLRLKSTSQNLPEHPGTLLTMKDPVPRTASPYTDPSIKGPRSQLLSSGVQNFRKSWFAPSPPALPELLRAPSAARTARYKLSCSIT